MDRKPKRPQAEWPATDMHRQQQQQASERRSGILQAVAYSTEGLMNATQLGTSITNLLKRVGQAAKVDRVYVFENQRDSTGTLVTSQRYKWIADGAAASSLTTEVWDFLLLDVGLQRWVEQLGSNQVIHGRVRDFPINERRLLTAHDVQSILIAPIQVKDDWWGIFGLDSCSEECVWTSEEIDAVTVVASVIGAAQENAQQHYETQHRTQQLVALRDVSRTVGGTLDQEAVLRLTIEHVRKLVPAARAAAYLADLSAGMAIPHAPVRSSSSVDVNPLPLSLKTSLTGQVIITGRPVFIEQGPRTQTDRSRERHTMPLPDNVQYELQTDTKDAFQARAAAFIPLAVGEHVLGTLNLAFDQPRAFNDEERRLLTAIGRQAGIALANARLFQETVAAERQARRRADQLSALHEIAHIVNASFDLDQTLSLLLDQLVKLVPYDSAAVFLHKDNTLGMAAGRGFPDKEAVRHLTIKTAENDLLRHVIETRKPLMLTDAQQDDRFLGWGGTEYVRGWLAVPLLLGAELVGILSIDRLEPGAYDDESARLAQALADQTAVAIYKTRLLDDLQRANRELRRLDEMKDQFIQNVAHELRTPLTLVRGYVELLAQENLDMTTQNEAIRTALSHTETLVQLVEAITTLQDLRLGDLTLDPLDLTELVTTSLQLASQKAVRAGIELRSDCPADPPALNGDFIWLSQALYQLLDNAIKFSPYGGYVTLKVRDDPGLQELQISVEDQGIGVPVDQQERVFELFYQADGTTTRRFGGTGLGLAIVQHVVQAHGGRVWVESPILQDGDGHGPGSRFMVRLPQHGP